jgi:uncharacterized RDD family membrane protein YckC
MSEPIGTQYGGFWIRSIALLADSAIVFMVSAALLAGAVIALGPEDIVPIALAVWVLGILYWPVMHASAWQATVGKAMLGLKLARVNGGRISIVRSLAREISKIFSAMVLMVGYLMAGFTPRKQALHDLMASTYVMREGSCHVIPALAVAVAGFALPIFGIPILVGGAMMSTMTAMAEGMISQQDPMKALARPAASPVAKAAPKPQATPPKPQATPPTPRAPAPTQTAQAPAPAPIAQAPAPATAAAAVTPASPPKPEAVAATKPAPVAVAKPAPVPETKPAPVAQAKPAAAPKPKPAPVRLARETIPARTPAPTVVATSDPKSAAGGPKYNDLMTAVMFRDSEGVWELLTLGKWPDKPDSRGSTPLMTAVELGDLRTAEALLRGGANPNLAIPVAEERRNGEMILLLKRYSGR